MPHLVVVPHTHWDREWYQTYEQFRYRLVELVDRLLPVLEGDPGFRHFTLDGQSIVVDDYLEVRPDSRERIEKLIRDGRILVGPWMVLPDEWLVSGEALIRNLRLGLRRSEALGGAMELGYAPDLFGHVGQLPQIFRGFGFPAAMLWRGVGADIERTPFEWEAPDGTRLFTVYLPFGYSNGTHLPLDHAALRARLEQEISRLERFSLVPSVLLMNGSDHVQPQPGLPAALESVAAALPDVSVEIGTLPGFVERARREVSGELPVHRGELRSGLRAPLLPGCASSRMAQKRADFRNDRLLTRYLEPLAAWLGALGGEPGVAVIEHAWRLAIQNHPHDSICGCSIDAVHDEIDARLARVEQIAELHLDRVAEAFGAHVAAPEAGFGAGAGRALFVWNPNGPGRAQVDSILEADLPVRRGRVGPFHLRDGTGRRIGARAELVEEGTTLMSFDTNGTGAAYILASLPEDLAGNRVQGLRHRREGTTLHVDLRLGAGACGFDFEAARALLEPRLADPTLEAVELRAQRVPRIRLRFVDELPGHGVRVYRLAPGAAGQADSDLRASPEEDAGGCVIENRFYRVAVAPSGEIELLHKPSGTRVADAIRLVDDGDRGDEYNFDPVPGGVVVERSEKRKLRVFEDPDAECTAVLHARYRVPARLERSRGARAARTVLLPVTLRLRLARELDRLDVEIEVDNTAEDHRMRLHVRAPGAPDRLEVESAFEVAQRTIAPEPDGFGSERPAEFPVGTSPQRSFASLRASSARGQALTVANRGGGEVEAVREADGTCSLALTLLRAVGWLSRGDLALRPGDAGPPLPTPGAQVSGMHRLEFSVRIHEDGEPRRIAEAHGFAYPPLARGGGSPVGAAVPDGARLARVDLPELVVSAIEPDEEGGALVRLLHASDRAASAALGFALPGAECLEGVDLRGQPDQALEAAFEGLSGHLELRPWQIVNLRIR